MDNISLILTIGGAMVTGLTGAVIKLWKQLTAKDDNHKSERKEWTEALEKMLSKQNETIRCVNENHDKALKEFTEKFDKRQGEINETMLTAFKTAFGKTR